MFGPRRRPVLGTALIVGASRASARREVDRQSQQQSQQQGAIEREAEAKRRREEEQDARVKRAVEEAIAVNAARGLSPGLGGGMGVGLGPSGSGSTPAPSPASPFSASPLPQPQQRQQQQQQIAPVADMSPISAPPSVYYPPGPTHEGRVNVADVAMGEVGIAASRAGSVSSPGAVGASGSMAPPAFVVYCPACGNSCGLEDLFCRKCGRKQPRDGRG